MSGQDMRWHRFMKGTMIDMFEAFLARRWRLVFFIGCGSFVVLQTTSARRRTGQLTSQWLMHLAMSRVIRERISFTIIVNVDTVIGVNVVNIHVPVITSWCICPSTLSRGSANLHSPPVGVDCPLANPVHIATKG